MIKYINIPYFPIKLHNTIISYQTIPKKAQRILFIPINSLIKKNSKKKTIIKFHKQFSLKLSNNHLFQNPYILYGTTLYVQLTFPEYGSDLNVNVF